MYRQQELPLEVAEWGGERPRGRSSLDERFEDFHAAHPWVFEALEALTARWVRGGGGRIGVKALFEQLRWSTLSAEGGREPFRLNNDFTSRYARLLLAEHPEWVEVFRVRSLRTGGEDGYLSLDVSDHVE